MRRELHHTLTEALAALMPVGAAADSGLVVTEAELDLPLELVAVERGGVPVIAGSAPHSRWHSGFLPAVHLARVAIVRTENPDQARDAQ